MKFGNLEVGDIFIYEHQYCIKHDLNGAWIGGRKLMCLDYNTIVELLPRTPYPSPVYTTDIDSKYEIY